MSAKGKAVEQDRLFERLWNGSAAMEEWTAAVSGGSARPVADNIIAVHTGYLFGNVTAIRTDAGLVLIDTGSRETAQPDACRAAPMGRQPQSTPSSTRTAISTTPWGARLLDEEADCDGVSPALASSPIATC